jgi:uncharacterized protein (PEP-CTERM system associated)
VSAQAQQAGGGASGGPTVTSRLSVMQTWTDNLLLTDQNKDAALITTVSPGVSISSNSGRLRGSLDYSLNGIAYFKTEQPSRLQNALAANAQAELVDRTLYVDMRASIGQQSASAFGLQSVPTSGPQGSVSSLVNANQYETATLSVSPSLRGMLGGVATYDLRGDFTRTEVRGSSLGDSRGRGGSLRVNEWNAGVLGWWLQASTQQVESVSVPANRSSSMRAGLTYRPELDWVLTANIGRERSDYLGNGASNGATGGLSVQWTPTPRTRLGADWQRHAYGDSHAFTFEHRMARSIWRYSDTQSTVLGNTGAVGSWRSAYDEYFLKFEFLQPDLVKRDALVRLFLASPGGFLSAGPSRLRSQQLGVTLQGVRSSLSAQASRSVSGRLGNNQNQGSLASSAQVEQRSYSLSAGYRLTPTAGLSLVASRQQTQGDTAGQSTQLSSLFASWNARLGARLSAQLGARHSRFEGATAYTENAVYAGLTQQF